MVMWFSRAVVRRLLLSCETGVVITDIVMVWNKSGLMATRTWIQIMNDG